MTDLTKIQAAGREIASAEMTESDGLDELCRRHGIEIRCNDKNAPEGLQWIFGWQYTYRGKSAYTLGGITKKELINHLLKDVKP